MADTKDTKRPEDRGRTHPFEFAEPRSQAEIVAEAYDHEDPTPTQMENDLAKLSAMNMGEIPEGGGDPQAAAAKRKHLEAAASDRTGNYQTRATGPASHTPATPKAEG